MAPRARDVLGRDSPLAASMAGYEERAAQLAMADAVEAALGAERALFVEAGTGTGKTLAYLVPAILSGKKVVVSTATRALQEQIFSKDLPLVRAALAAHGVTFRAALMKGLTNYLCKRRQAELPRAALASWADPEAAAIEEWGRRTQSGDRAELSTLREEAQAWLDVQSSTETRIGAGCKFFEECFVTLMRREAADAEIVVVNHHLFFADLALRASAKGDHPSVLPAYDAVIFDEAHEVEDIATAFFGVRLSQARVDALARDALRVTLAGGGGAGARAARGSTAATLPDQLVRAGRAFFAAVGGRAAGELRRALSPEDFGPTVVAAGAELDAALEAVTADAETRSQGGDAALQVARRGRDARADLAEIMSSARPDVDDASRVARVAWLHSGARTVSVGSSPVELGGLLRRALFDRVPSVVCTSATLATRTGGASSAGPGSCHFARARLGAPPETQELVLASPFDFASRAALYLPRDLPEPADPSFDAAAAGRVAELVRITGGGAFVLCTSTRAMRRIHEALVGALPSRPMLQGEAPKLALLERFKRDGDAVLVATMSFWEGVDVPGRALRLVVIDKIPFAVPTDPVVMARCASVERSGGNPFAEYSVPCAAITLKQGFGRLLRGERDAGVVAVLDRRLTTKGYGRPLLASLPPARRVTTLEEVRRFWGDVFGGPVAAEGLC